VELTKHTSCVTGCETTCWADVQGLLRRRIHAQYAGKHFCLATADEHSCRDRFVNPCYTIKPVICCLLEEILKMELVALFET